MKNKRIARVLKRIIEYPKIAIGRARGLYADHLLCCLTARDLVNRPFKTIIDVGANKGIFIDVCNYLFPNANVYAFEPIPELYQKIKNKKNVIAFNFGLWNSLGESVFYLNKDDSGMSSFLKPTREYNEFKTSKDKMLKRKLLRKRFDSLNIKIERPCFVKIDVEGAEEKVIRGFGNKLKEVDVLQLEWFFKTFHVHQMKLSKILPLLEKYGFVGFVQREVNSINNILTTCDLIFFKEKNNSY